MNKIVLTALVAAFSFSVFAQQEAAVLKNEGNDALVAKNYALALEKYEEFFKTGGDSAMLDDATVYNAATCAQKLNKYAEAEKYFSQSIKRDYKGDLAMYYIAVMKKDQGDEVAYNKGLENVLKSYPDSKYYKTILSKVVANLNKEAAEPFNKAVQMSQEAAADPKTYVEKMEEAVKIFLEAKTSFEKTLAVDSTNSAAKNSIESIDAQIKTFEDYKAKLTPAK